MEIKNIRFSGFLKLRLAIRKLMFLDSGSIAKKSAAENLWNVAS
jgi:hypothetical protein